MSLNVQSPAVDTWPRCCHGLLAKAQGWACMKSAVFRTKSDGPPPHLTWCAEHAADLPAEKLVRILPRRIRLSRQKGWRMPAGAVKVDRTTIWGNPFLVGADRTQAVAVRCFLSWLTDDAITAGIPNVKQRILLRLPELRGRDVACWCKQGEPCHGDVLLQLANPEAAFAPDLPFRAVCRRTGTACEIRDSGDPTWTLRAFFDNGTESSFHASRLHDWFLIGEVPGE